MKISFGRHVFGLAAIGFGIFGLAFRDFNTWQHIRALGNVPHREILLYVAVAFELFGGIAIQFPKSARAGAIALGVIYMTFALLWVPLIAAQPGVYDLWANFFEQFSLVSGALIVFGTACRSDSTREFVAARIGYFGFAVCVISFTLEQAFYLHGTAGFVPRWIPPGQMFWAIATTVFFALAAIALLIRRAALPAARLLTLMIIGFGVLIWLPIVLGDPNKLFNWAGNAENLAICGSAWIVTDFLSAKRA
jgi:uncharacterized membrane protein YphA (DoxX/SURF4 family)